MMTKTGRFKLQCLVNIELNMYYICYTVIIIFIELCYVLFLLFPLKDPRVSIIGIHFILVYFPGLLDYIIDVLSFLTSAVNNLEDECKTNCFLYWLGSVTFPMVKIIS